MRPRPHDPVERTGIISDLLQRILHRAHQVVRLLRLGCVVIRVEKNGVGCGRACRNSALIDDDGADRDEARAGKRARMPELRDRAARKLFKATASPATPEIRAKGSLTLTTFSWSR